MKIKGNIQSVECLIIDVICSASGKNQQTFSCCRPSLTRTSLFFAVSSFFLSSFSPFCSFFLSSSFHFCNVNKVKFNFEIATINTLNSTVFQEFSPDDAFPWSTHRCSTSPLSSYCGGFFVTISDEASVLWCCNYL